MTSRERMLAAIRHAETDRVPVDAIWIENLEAIGRWLNIPADEVIAHLGIDGRCMAAGTYTGERPHRDGRALSPWGTESDDDYGSAHVYPLADATCVSDVERHTWPDATRFDFAALRETLRTWPGTYALRGPYWVSAPLFCTTCNLMGMEDALCSTKLEPAVFEACVDQVFNFSRTYVEHYLEAAGSALDILYLADDFASQRGLMMDPAVWRRYLKPRYAQLFALGKQRGLPVWFHSCGDITAVLPDLIEIGLDVWETVQLDTLPMTPIELKRRFGREITFFGGVSTQRLPFQSPAAVADEVRRCIDALGAGGGYICGPDHHIKPDVPPANAVALFETACSHRRQD